MMHAKELNDFGPFGRGRGGFGPGFHGLDETFGSLRAGRGMMEPAILGALSEKPMHGYELITYLEEKSHGMWRPSPGSVYPTLQLLGEKGEVEAEETSGKKVYNLTDAGKKRVEELSHLSENWKENFSDRLRGMKDHRKMFGETMHLVRDIYRKGSREQNDALIEALDTFSKRLRQIKEGEL